MFRAFKFTLQRSHPRAVVFGIRAIINKQRINTIVRHKSLQGESQLPQVVHALGSLRSRVGVGKYWQQKRCQNSDDGDNH